ncbi:hypothetical protein HYALB_00013815 [Hymenoscyphus albidus]|uniref:Uncharacterized protein n=1 Tax=Hymenoscyphus albidus TaxID=595503 RepID=A0A9N9QBF8_9HELO|nr:hypothetical protein HYALB_00013815 [Hymenoscyphus albidus]
MDAHQANQMVTARTCPKNPTPAGTVTRGMSSTSGPLGGYATEGDRERDEVGSGGREETRGC